MTKHVRAVPLLVLAALAVAAAGLPAAALADAERIIVSSDPGLTGAQRAEVRADAGVSYERSLPVANTQVVTAPQGHAAEALRELNADPDVRYAEPVVSFRTADAPGNDTFFSRLWALNNTGQLAGAQAGTPDADLDAIEAWSLSRGAAVVVGVVDTGTYLGHPDLAGRIAPGGQSFVAGVSSPTDDSTDGHGTHVSGIVAADENNGFGSAGVAPSSQVLPLKAIAADGTGTSDAIAAALSFAGAKGLRVVNASLAGTSYSQVVRNAIAANPKTLYVVPAGNGGTNDDGATPDYPCDFPEANLICVAASDNRDAASASSNFGPTSVDLYAPGIDILSTLNSTSQQYGYLSGSSMASAMVAGEAALIASRYPGLTTAQLKSTILRSVDRPAALAGLSATGGRANAYAALTDSDGDQIPNAADNCPALANAAQADADGDGVGDACDPTPRGPDVDGDGKAALDDRCPTVAAATADGCPPPFVPASKRDTDGDGRSDASDACPNQPAHTIDGCPVPSVRKLALAVTPHKRCARGHRCSKAVKVSVTPDRSSEATLRIERRKCSHGLCRWSRVSVRSFRAGVRGASQTVKPLGRGRYRASVVLSAVAGVSRPARKSFTVA